MTIETGQLDLATDIADESAVQVERHGFEYAAMLVTIQRATIRAMSALSACGGHPDALQPHIDVMSRIVDHPVRPSGTSSSASTTRSWYGC